MSSDDKNSMEEVTPATRSAGRRLQLWIVLLVVVTLLPSVVTVTGTAARGLNWIHPELARITEFKDFRLHWWAPIECSDLRISNTREWSSPAPPLLTVQRIKTQQSLWQVAWNLGRGIDITVTEPELNLVNSNNGSNLTDAIKDLGGDGQSEKSTFPFRLAVNDGRINVATSGSGPAPSESNKAYVIERLISGIHFNVSTLDLTNILPDVCLVATLGSTQSNTATASRGPSSHRTTVHPRVATGLDQLAAGFQPLRLDLPGRDPESIDLPSIEIKLGPVGDSTQRALRFVARELKLDVLEPLIAQIIPGVHCRGLLSLQGEALMPGKLVSDGFTFRAVARGADLKWRQSTWAPTESLQLSTASAECAIAMAKDGIIVQRLSANCPFASVHGDGEIRLSARQVLKSILDSAQGSDADRAFVPLQTEAAAAGQVHIKGQADLVAISRMLPRTLHLREGIQLTEGSVQFSVKTQSPASSVEGLQTLDWQAVMESSRIVARQGRDTVRWDAPIRLQCSGPLRMSAVELHSATLSGDFGQIHARPVRDALDIHGRIDVDRLWNHLGQFIDRTPPGIRGEVQVDAYIGLPETGDVLLRDVKVLADNVIIESDHLAVHTEQSLLNMLDGHLSVKGTGAAVRSLVVPWTDLNWLSPESQVSVQLDAAPSQRLTVVGEIQPGSAATVSTGPWQSSSGLLINQARLAVDIDTDSQPDHYVVRSGYLQIPGLTAELSGTLETVGERMTTQLVIEADYDLAVLSRMALNDPTEDIRFTGQKHSRFIVQGMSGLWAGNDTDDAEPLRLTGEIGWDAADVYGLQLGPGVAPFRLQDGQIQTEPIRCSLNEGQLSAMVNYDLRRNHVSLASGSRVENIAVTEHLTSRWLGYVAPFLAGAAAGQGSVSARVNRFHYNFDRPELSTVTGTVDIHGITASPGYSLSVLLQTLDTLRPGRRSPARDLIMPSQQVRCELQNGVITHDQLMLTLSGYNLKSQGAVGLNKQLNLTLEVAVKQPGGQRPERTVLIPVHGSVSQPKIDVSLLVRDAGTRRIQDEINSQFDRGLNQLFDKLR